MPRYLVLICHEKETIPDCSFNWLHAWINPVLTTSMRYKLMFKEMLLLLTSYAIEDMGLLTLLFWMCTLWTRTVLQADLYMLWPFRPAIHLPGPSKPVVAVRFCPIIFSLETDVPEEETSSCGELIQILICVDIICLVLSQRVEKVVPIRSVFCWSIFGSFTILNYLSTLLICVRFY